METLEKINRFFFLGKWYVIYTKWIIFGMIMCFFITNWLYNVEILDENWIKLMKVQFFLSLYVSSIALLFSFKFKSEFNSMNNGLKIGQTVVKLSNKPFKSGLQKEVIVDFGFNKNDPKNRRCAIFKDGSVCNVDLLKPY